MANLILNASNPVQTTGQVQPIVPVGTPQTYYQSCYRVISTAMRNAGYLDRLQDPSSDDIAEFLPRLNDLINFEQTQGLKLWLNQDISFIAIQGYNVYQFGSQFTNTVSGTYFPTPVGKPLRVIEAYWQDQYGNRRPLIPMARTDWDTLGTVTTQGAVNSWFAEKQQNFLSVWIWLSPDLYTATMGQVHVILEVQVNNAISLTDNMNFPVEWQLFLQWGLAAEIDTGQPKEITDTCDKMRSMYRSALEDFDVEDASTSFAPDSRSQYVMNRFV